MKLIDKIAGNIEKRRKGITYDRLSKMADIPLSTLMNIKRKQIMVLGVPNVGKSTLINTLAGKKVAKTGDKPSITRGIT